VTHLQYTSLFILIECPVTTIHSFIYTHWISSSTFNVVNLGQQEYEVLFAYKEAIEFMIGHIVKELW